LRDLRAAAAPRGLGSLASPVAGIIVGNDGSVTAIGTGGELGHWRAGGGASAGGGLTVPGRPVALAPAGDGAVIVATADGALHRVDTRLRQVATLAPVDRAIAVAAVAASGMVATAGAGDGAVQLRDPVVGGAAGGAVRTLDAGSPVAALAFDRTGTRLFAASADGFVRLWDARAGVLLAQALSTEGGWAVLDPAGRFDGSAQGMDDVRWQAPQVALPIESFSATYYEPGLLARQGAQPAAAALAPAPVPRIEDGIRLPPQARLEAVGAAAGGPPQPFELRVVLIDQGGGIEEARVFQNGKRVPPSSILRDETGRSGGAATRTLTVRATPIPGANRWEAVGIGTGRVEGLAATLDLTFAPPARRPTLHLVTVGINDYAFADVERRLRFAVPDAKAVAARLAGQRAAGFETVERYGLYDRQATRAEILGVLDRLKGVPADDVVAVYLAGHGETVGGDWHFVTYDVTDLEDLRSIGARGLSAPALRDALLAVGAERVVLMVDACKSGGAVTPLADVADRRALREMAKSAGLHVLAATGRDQLTPEFATLGHGSFTYVVLDGLAGAADRAPRDGWVSIRELIGHAERRLPGFTRDQVEKAITLMMRAQTSRGLIEQIRGQPIPIPTAFSRGADFTLSRIGSR
ncbi:MAG: caspase family protein, partial [Alphaproteobacteria bacterium]